MGQAFFSFLNVGLARKGSHPRRRQTGLCLLTLFLGVSGVIRLGNGVGLAYAETSKPPSPVAGAAPTGAGTAEPVASGTWATGATCPADAGALAMLQSLKEREGRLAEQEANAAEKEQSLTLARVAVEYTGADAVRHFFDLVSFAANAPAGPPVSAPLRGAVEQVRCPCELAE